MKVLYSHKRTGDKTVVTMQIEGEKKTYKKEYSSNFFQQLDRSNIDKDDLIFIDFMKLLRKEGNPLFEIEEVTANRRKLNLPKLKKLIIEGRSARAIGVILMISMPFVRKYVDEELPEMKRQLLRNGREAQSHPEPRKSEFPVYEERVISLLKEGKSCQEIANALDVAHSTILKWVTTFLPEHKEEMIKQGKLRRWPK